MTKLTILKWLTYSLTVITLILLASNWATIGILLMAVDAIDWIVYEMTKNACDRRQMHHVPVVHHL